MRSQVFKVVDDVNKLCLRFEVRVDGEEDVYELRWMQEVAPLEKKKVTVHTKLEAHQMRVVATCREEEAVLCTIRHTGEYLEMRPGFSPMEDPLFDDRRSNYAVSVGGRRVEYSICDGQPRTEEELDVLYRFQREQDALQKALNEDSWKEILGAVKKNETRKDGVSLCVEIQTLTGFDHCDWLFVDYEVHLPRGWCGLGESWTYKNELYSKTGRTQLSKNTNASKEDDYVLIPIFLAFVFGLLAGPSYALWLIFGSVLFCVDHGCCCCGTHKTTAHFNLPIELEFCREEEEDCRESPVIYFQITSKRSFGRYVVEGYAYSRLDESFSGRTTKFMHTWRPSSTIRRHVQDFFVGGGHRLADLRSVAYPTDDYAPSTTKSSSDEGRSFSSSLKFGFATETSGYVQIATTYDVVERTRQTQQQKKSRGRQAIDNILASLKESNSLEVKENEPSARERAQELIAKLQAERAKLKERYAMGKVVPSRKDNGDDSKRLPPEKAKSEEEAMYHQLVSPSPASATLV